MRMSCALLTANQRTMHVALPLVYRSCVDLRASYLSVFWPLVKWNDSELRFSHSKCLRLSFDLRLLRTQVHRWSAMAT